MRHPVNKFYLISLIMLILFSVVLLPGNTVTANDKEPKINVTIGVSPNTQNLKKNTFIVFQFDLIDNVYKEPKWQSYKSTREQQMTELFETYLIKYGKNIIDRTKINQLLKELNFSATGLSTDDAKRIGKMTNADVLIFGTISRISFWTDTKTILIIASIKAIHVETGRLLWKGDLDGTINYTGSPTEGESEVQELSRKLFDKLLTEAQI